MKHWNAKFVININRGYHVIHASVFINDFLKAVYLTDRNLTICFREQYGHNQYNS